MIIMTTYFTRTSVLIKRHDAVWHLLMVQPEYTRTNPTDASKLNMPTKNLRIRHAIQTSQSTLAVLSTHKLYFLNHHISSKTCAGNTVNERLITPSCLPC